MLIQKCVVKYLQEFLKRFSDLLDGGEIPAYLIVQRESEVDMEKSGPMEQWGFAGESLNSRVASKR